MFVDTFTFLLPLALGFAAGCMTWIVFAELIPDALEAAPHGKVPAAVHVFRVCLAPVNSLGQLRPGAVEAAWQDTLSYQ